MKKKPIPLWWAVLIMVGEVVGIYALLRLIWHNIKCALGV